MDTVLIVSFKDIMTASTVDTSRNKNEPNMSC